MAVITKPAPGTNFSNGVSTPALSMNNGVYPLNENVRWQWNLTGTESGSDAGSDLQLQAIADDGTTILSTPISVDRSSGLVTLNAAVSGQFADGTVSAPSISFDSSNSTGVYYTTNAVNITAAGVRSMSFATATTGVNYALVTPAAANGDVAITAAGADTNVGLILSGKGSDPVSIGGTTVANGSVHVVTTSSSVNWLEVAGSATGSAVTMTTAGTDTDVGLTITAKGAGGIIVGDTTSNLTLGPGTALATDATVGHAQIPTCAGTPSGEPAGTAAGKAAIIFDSTGTKLWVYKHGTGWVGVVVS